MLKLSPQALTRCMQSAVRRGFNPYDSHATQSVCWKRAWKDKARRMPPDSYVIVDEATGEEVEFVQVQI